VLVVNGRGGCLLKLLQHGSEALTGLRGVRMVGAQTRLKDGESPLIAGAGCGQLSEPIPHVPDVCESGSDIGVVRTKAGLKDGQGAVVVRAGGGQILKL